jgi:1-acyl-sn-glycerol-3-phosphate acyltransferase
MRRILPAPLTGVIGAVLLAGNTLVFGSLLLLFAVGKFLLPFVPVRRRLDPILNWMAEQWISNNRVWANLLHRTQWHIRGIDTLRRRGWYLVEANHQSWADIFVMQEFFNRRIPLLKFFLKQELIYVPIIGLAWWALDFPFMRRYSEEYLKKHPEKRGADLETIRNACRKFTLVPTSVMTFLEGTRFTAAKHAKQQSPYRHLLRPKTGGIALAMTAMGETFHSIVDVTLFYPEGAPSFWEYLCGKMERVVVQVRELPIPAELLHGDYAGDAAFRARMQAWVQQLWQEKDATLEALRIEFSEPAPAVS